jgi:hypothetical protein
MLGSSSWLGRWLFTPKIRGSSPLLSTTKLNFMILYRLKHLSMWVEGAYNNEREAIKHLADQLFTFTPCVYPRICRGVTIRVRHQNSKKIWYSRRIIIYPFKEKHWKQCEGFSLKIDEFRYEELG